jgi:hypothetical protein
VPRRTIPVRIAPTPAREIRPVGAVPLHAVARAPTTLPGSNEQICRRCGRALPVERRFCACGAALARRPADEVSQPVRAASWWSEWSAHRRFRGAQRLAAGGAPVSYDAPVSARTRLVRLVVILIVVAALAAAAALAVATT